MSSRIKIRLEAVNPLYSVAVISLVVLAGLGYLLTCFTSKNLGPDGKTRELMVFCAAGMRVPAEQIAKDYQAEFGVTIRYQYGGSNSLLSQLEVSKLGDLYLAADESYINIAQEKKLVAEIFPLARMHAVIAVPFGNPAKVQTVDDLLRQDLRVALANPDQAAMGKITRECMIQVGKWEKLEKRVREDGVFKPTVNDVANDIVLGSVDAGVVWDAVAQQTDHRNPSKIEIVRVPEFTTGSVKISVGVLTSTKSPRAALHFARYLAAQDRGLPVFEKQGYQPVAGDLWSDNVQLTFFAGAVNRRVLEPIVKEFEQRHGVEVLTLFNGCGILTAQMRALGDNTQAGSPDAFMACDVHYMNVVDDLFQERANISDVPIIIVVQPGNPKGIASLEDLVKPGIRLAIGQPEQCTIGVLSRRLLEDANLYKQAMKSSVVTQTATSSLLISSIVTGAADAALVYRSDAQAENKKVEILPLNSPLAQAIQPYGIAKTSQHKHLGRLLFQAISRSRQSFESVGFRWRLNTELTP